MVPSPPRTISRFARSSRSDSVDGRPAPATRGAASSLTRTCWPCEVRPSIACVTSAGPWLCSPTFVGLIRKPIVLIGGEPPAPRRGPHPRPYPRVHPPLRPTAPDLSPPGRRTRDSPSARAGGAVAPRLPPTRARPPRAHAPHPRRQDARQRDKRDIDRREIDEFGHHALVQVRRVGPLQHHHAGVPPQAPVQLPRPYVYRVDLRGTVLQQTIRESTGRGADVQRDRALHRDVEGPQRVLQFLAAPADGLRPAWLNGDRGPPTAGQVEPGAAVRRVFWWRRESSRRRQASRCSNPCASSASRRPRSPNGSRPRTAPP